MRLAPVLRLLATAVLLLAGTGAIWWLVGFQIGKGVLSDTRGLGTFRQAYGFEVRPFLDLLALALVVPVTREVRAEAQAGPARWLALAGVAFGAALLFGERGGGGAVSMALFVFAAAAAAEASGAVQIAAALAGALLVALAQALALPLDTGERLLAVALRAALFYGPLLLGPTWIDRALGRGVA